MPVEPDDAGHYEAVQGMLNAQSQARIAAQAQAATINATVGRRLTTSTPDPGLRPDPRWRPSRASGSAPRIRHTKSEMKARCTSSGLRREPSDLEILQPQHRHRASTSIMASRAL